MSQQMDEGETECFGDPSHYADYVQLLGRSTTLLRGPLPIYHDGFQWATVVEQRGAVVTRDDEASAVKDDDIVARGHVDDIEADYDGSYLIHVAPE